MNKKMTDFDPSKYHPMVGVPIETVKTIKVRKKINLTLWEKLYIFEVIRGLYITTRHFVLNMVGFVIHPKGKKRNIFTIYYPEEKVTPPPAYRGRPVLVMGGDGIEKCVACGLCEKICPAHAISMVAGEKEGEDRHPISYILDMSRCVYCGYCEEVCPKEAIVMSGEYQGLAQRDRNNLRFPKEKLLRSEESVKDRIEFIRRIYSKCNY
jgi:NADH-quinone oxidoreductase subunit I